MLVDDKNAMKMAQTLYKYAIYGVSILGQVWHF